MEKLAIDNINSYYARCAANYRHLWNFDENLAIHAGYWDENTRTLSQALLKENQILAEMAHITSTDRVLDAGCGAGGSSLYLAESIGCHVTGIDVAESLLEIANKRLQQLSVKDRVEFKAMDFTSTTFPDGSFDVIWSLESSCHVSDKLKFIKEAWRLLAPKGRLVLADGFCNDKSSKLLNHMQDDFGDINYESLADFSNSLKAQGFQLIETRNASQNIVPSSFRLYLYSFPLIAYSKIGEYLGWSSPSKTQDYWGYYHQYAVLRQGICSYMMLCAQKP